MTSQDIDAGQGTSKGSRDAGGAYSDGGGAPANHAEDAGMQDGNDGPIDSTRDGRTRSSVEPRVILGDEKTDSIIVYDRAGRPLRDLRPELELAAGYDDLRFVVGNFTYIWQQDPASAAAYTPPPELRDVSETAEPSWVVALGPSSASGTTRVRAVSASGERKVDTTVSGSSTRFALSPGRSFYYASVSGQTVEASVIRLGDGQVVWRGSGVDDATFARDDSHFVAAMSETEIQLTDLKTGATSLLASPVPLQPVGASGSLECGSEWGALFKTNEYARRSIVFLDWSGSWWDAHSPEYREEWVVGSRDQGRGIFLHRSSYFTRDYYGPVDPSLLGYFDLDIVTHTSKRLDPQPNPNCLKEPVGPYYQLDGATLSRCDCPSEDCEVIAALPPLEAEWTRTLAVAPGGRAVAMVPVWSGGERAPKSDVLVYDREGKLLAQVPSSVGSVHFDTSGTLALLDDIENEFIIDLASLHVTTLSGSRFAAIVYE